jgi:hypothetical protein
MVRMTSLLAVVAALLASTAAAQQAPMSEDLVWKLLELGRVVDMPKTAALFAPMQQKEPYQGVKTEREVKYGPADRHLLDVFAPETASPARPVLIFIHGGGFVAGNKRAPGSPFCDNVMLWAVNNRQRHLSPCPAVALPGRRRRSRRHRGVGHRQDRRARRRSRAHLPHGTFRWRNPRCELRLAS